MLWSHMTRTSMQLQAWNASNRALSFTSLARSPTKIWNWDALSPRWSFWKAQLTRSSCKRQHRPEEAAGQEFLAALSGPGQDLMHDSPRYQNASNNTMKVCRALNNHTALKCEAQLRQPATSLFYGTPKSVDVTASLGHIRPKRRISWHV